MALFFTDRVALRETVAALGHTRQSDRGSVPTLVVPDRMPFFLARDGTYDHLINGFLRDLPSHGCHSPESWRAFAYDIKSLQSFLDRARGAKQLLEVTYDDLRAFRRQRLEGDLPEVSRRTWNRAVSSLEKLFDYLVSHHHIPTSPFRYATWTGSSQRQATRGRNTLLEAIGETDDVKSVSAKDYHVFRNVGLRGLMHDQRTPDPSFEGRCGERNAILADLMVGTGTRITEATSFLRFELRCVGVPATGASEARVTDAVAKRGHGRRIFVPNRVLGAIGRYVSRDRAHAVAGAIVDGRYASDAGWLHAGEATGASCRIQIDGAERKVAYEGLGVDHRRRLLVGANNGSTWEPAALWLTEKGLPLTSGAVRTAFSRACERCERLGVPVRITPHTLRHTFAVHMLSALVKASFRRVAEGRASGATHDEHLLSEVTADPVDTLRRLLGHRSVTTTYKYLTFIEQTQRYVAEAFDELDQVSGLAERLRVVEHSA